MTKYYSNKSDFESGSGTTTSAGTGYMNYGGYGDQTGDTQVTNLLKDIKEVTQVVQDEGVSDLYKQIGEASLGKDMPSNTFTTSYNRAEKLLDLAKRVHGEVLERIDGKFTKGIDESLKSLNKVNGSDKPYKTKNLTYQKSIPYTDENGNLYYYQQTETYTLSELLDQKASPIKSTQKVYKEKLKQFRDKINNATDMSAKEIEKYKKMSDKELMATFYHGQISNYSGLKHFKWQEDNKEWLEPVEKYLGIGLFAVSAVATVFSFGTTSPALAATAAFVATTSGTMGTTYSLVDGGYSAITGNTLISGTELDFDDRVWAAAEAFASVSSFGVGKAFKFAGAADDTLAKVAKTTGVVEDTVNLSHIGYNAVVKGEDPTLSLVTFAGGKVVGDISKRAEAKWKNSGSQNGNIDAVTSPKDLSTIKGKNVDTDVPVKPHVDVETSKIKPVEAMAGVATAVPKSKKPDIDVLTKSKDLSTIKGEAVDHVGTVKPKVELDVPEVKQIRADYNDYVAQKTSLGEKPLSMSDWKQKVNNLKQNQTVGKKFKVAQTENFKQIASHVENRITIATTVDGQIKKVQVDAIGFDSNGKIRIQDYTASSNISSKRQAILDNIERNGGVIVGKGKGKFVGGVEIPKGTRIDVIKGGSQFSPEWQMYLNEFPKVQVDKNKVDEILKINPNPDSGVFRPEPQTYLPKEYRQAHKELFDDGVAAFVKDDFFIQKFGNFGREDGAFVFPKDVAKAMIKEADGNPRKLEALLGLDEGSLGDTPKMVLPQEVHNYRIPDGNEGGSRDNSQWRPGGKTYPGGVPEAVIDPVPKDKVTLVDVW